MPLVTPDMLKPVDEKRKEQSGKDSQTQSQKKDTPAAVTHENVTTVNANDPRTSEGSGEPLSENDKKYIAGMEDEYAKRDGGA
jgi:hypothetical protein